MPRQRLYLISVMCQGGRWSDVITLLSTRRMSAIPQLDSSISRTTCQHLLMNRIPTQTHDSIGMTSFTQSSRSILLLVFLLLLLLATAIGRSTHWHLHPHPLLFRSTSVHTTQYKRRFKCIHHVEVPNFNTRLEGTNGHIISSSNSIVFIGLIRTNHTPQSKTQRKRRKRNVMMHIQIVIFRIKHIDFKRCKIFFCLGHQNQRILISNLNIINVILIFFLVIFLLIQIIIVHGHILQIF
mmetsp:Transcript_25983/g.52135  ORF Transcript_25983/g.52135 Transcript_25983/m.52135 type:complete len:239 (-) Transcript_25983:818-1534(-)